MRAMAHKFALTSILLATGFATQAFAQNGQTMIRYVNEYMYFPGVTRVVKSVDSPCNWSLPLLCFRADYIPVPQSTYPEKNPNHCLFTHNRTYCGNSFPPRREIKNWSGGVISPTERVRGDRFAHILDADAYCAQTFGPRWRVARKGEDGYPSYNGYAEFSAYDMKDGGRYPNGRLTPSPHLGIGMLFWVGKSEPTDNECWSEN
jgi:hypothetical protein